MSLLSWTLEKILAFESCYQSIQINGFYLDCKHGIYSQSDRSSAHGSTAAAQEIVSQTAKSHAIFRCKSPQIATCAFAPCLPH